MTNVKIIKVCQETISKVSHSSKIYLRNKETQQTLLAVVSWLCKRQSFFQDILKEATNTLGYCKLALYASL